MQFDEYLLSEAGQKELTEYIDELEERAKSEVVQLAAAWFPVAWYSHSFF